MESYKKIGLGYNCEFEWDVLDKKDKTFILKVHGCSKQDQQNALIDVMKYLCKEGIEPAIVLSTKTKKSDAELKFDQVKRILKFA